MSIKNRIKSLVAQEDKKLKEIAPVVGKSLSSLSGQLKRSTMSFDDAEKIADFLGYDIVFVKRKPEQ